jgi:hypothetical protein
MPQSGSIIMRDRMLTASLALMLCAGHAAAQSAACPSAKAEAAEAAADKLSTWQAVGDYYRHYRRCDEGGMAETSSEAIARLLVDQWTTLPALAAETKHAPGLKSFVAAHINSTLDTSDIQKIAQTSAASCPANVSGLCATIHRAAHEALQ